MRSIKHTQHLRWWKKLNRGEYMSWSDSRNGIPIRVYVGAEMIIVQNAYVECEIYAHFALQRKMNLEIPIFFSCLWWVKKGIPCCVLIFFSYTLIRYQQYWCWSLFMFQDLRIRYEPNLIHSSAPQNIEDMFGLASGIKRHIFYFLFKKNGYDVNQ